MVSIAVLAEPLLTVRTAVSPADVIVVLGGDGPRRAAKASALYRAGAAPRVLISGDGDCMHIRRLMMEDGVPAQRITTECESGSTYENALLSTPILLDMGVRRAVLVTSWFHTRRALACFTTTLPRIDWMSAPVERDRSLWDLMTSMDGLQLAKEYVKICWYAFLCNDSMISPARRADAGPGRSEDA